MKIKIIATIGLITISPSIFGFDFSLKNVDEDIICINTSEAADSIKLKCKFPQSLITGGIRSGYFINDEYIRVMEGRKRKYYREVEMEDGNRYYLKSSPNKKKNDLYGAKVLAYSGQVNIYATPIVEGSSITYDKSNLITETGYKTGSYQASNDTLVHEFTIEGIEALISLFGRSHFNDNLLDGLTRLNILHYDSSTSIELKNYDATPAPENSYRYVVGHPVYPTISINASGAISYEIINTDFMNYSYDLIVSVDGMEVILEAGEKNDDRKTKVSTLMKAIIAAKNPRVLYKPKVKNGKIYDRLITTNEVEQFKVLHKVYLALSSF